MRVFGASVAVLGAAVLAGVVVGVVGGAEGGGNRITHGPVLGRLSADGVGVWARTAYPGEFVVRYGPAADRLEQQAGPVTTSLEHDNTGWVHVTGLRANATYYYGVSMPGEEAPGERRGSFRTLPDAEELAEAELNPRGLFNFCFEVACGNSQARGGGRGPELPAYRTMLEKLGGKIAFAILNGDWLYEEKREYGVDEWLGQVGGERSRLPRVLQIAPTLVGVWENYKLYYDRSENLRRWHRQIPSYYTYDDHEVLNDVYGTGEAGFRNRRAVFRDIGVQAWYDYLAWSNPAAEGQGIWFGRGELQGGSDRLRDGAADFTKLDLNQATNLHVHWGTETAGVDDVALDGVGGMENAGVYRIVRVVDGHTLQIEPAARADEANSYSIGRRNWYRLRVANCDFFVLDTRGQRELHDINDPGKKGLSLLGQAQREWLREGMAGSDADFLFVVSSVNFSVPHVGAYGARPANKDEAWTVFLEEREALIEFWDQRRQPVFVLTGDLHNSFVVRITDNVWEMACAPHNSMNHKAADEGNAPANGLFVSGPRQVEIRWSSHFRNDVPRELLRQPLYCVVQANNVFNNPVREGEERWVAFPRPQVVFQYYDGLTGELRYAESVLAAAS